MPYRPVYIHEGRVLRNGRDGREPYRGFTAPLRTFVEWKRVAMLLVPILVLWVTNPSNRFPGRTTPRSQWRSGRPRITNYGIFSLEETIEGVTLFGLRKHWEVCTFADASVGELCANLADNLCHRKPLFLWDYRVRNQGGANGNGYGNGYGNGNGYKSWIDRYRTIARNYGAALAEDRVFVAHRFLCACLILSAAWKFCCPRFPASLRVLAVTPITPVNDVVTSVLWSTTGMTLFRDLVAQNFCVYPCLVELDRLLPRFRRSSWLVRPSGNESADYALAVLVLVLGIGGGSNALAGHIVPGHNRWRRTLSGYASVAAAALGYAVRVGRSSSEAWTLAVRLGATPRRFGLVHAYWTHAAWILIGHPDEWYPRVVVWLLAGLAGSLWAEIHLEHVEFDVLQDLLAWFGLR